MSPPIITIVSSPDVKSFRKNSDRDFDACQTKDYAHLEFDGLDQNTPPKTQRKESDKIQLINGYYNMISSHLGKGNACFASRAYGLLLEGDDALQRNPALRAKLYYAVLEDLVKNAEFGNDLSNEALKLYRKANEGDVWHNYPVMLEYAQQLLTRSGIISYSDMISSHLEKESAYCAKRAYTLLLEGDGALQKDPTVRANLYYAVFEDLVENAEVENNLSNKALKLYRKANEGDIWCDYPVIQEYAQQLLATSGITF